MTEQLSLFTGGSSPKLKSSRGTTEKLKRLDSDPRLRELLLPLCRLKPGEIWDDPEGKHRVGVLDATRAGHVRKIMAGQKTRLVVNDPPYNVAVGNANTQTLSKTSLVSYLEFSKGWIKNTIDVLDQDSHLYIWIGTDFRDNFQPLPDLMILMRELKELSPRNLITMRNQRGYGTQKNWMWVRQELLYYVRGKPRFSVIYTDIPKVLKGYYKEVGGKRTENVERSKSETIRCGNVWVDIQQVFYRMEENVPGCYAQKPLKALERILASSSQEGELVVDFFAHSGTTLIAGEKLGRRVYTFDIDPIFAEISIRRLERYRSTGKSGWHWENPFPEIIPDLGSIDGPTSIT